MKPFKTKQEIVELKREFVDGVGKSDVWSVSGLSQLSNDDLISRLVQIDNQATLMKWRIFWILRQRYDSDTLFGQYIAELRSHSTQTLCFGSQMDTYRTWTAGRFCETYEINDLSDILISQTAIYELSRPVNEAVAGDIFNAIKYQKVPVYEVKRLLEQARSTTIEEFENDLESSDVDDLLPQFIDEHFVPYVEVIDYQTLHRREELLQELSEIGVAELSDQQIAKEILTFVKAYKNLPTKIIYPIIHKLEKIAGLK